MPEVAALLGISRIAVFKRVKKGQLQALRIGRNWAVPAVAVPAPPSAADFPAVPPTVLPPPAAKSQVSPGADAADAEMDSMGWD